MKETLLELFNQYSHLAIAISLMASIIVAVLGFLPSVFITAANILFFGFWEGTLISFLGEAVGAGLAFLLYRKGLKKLNTQKLQQFPAIQKLIHAKGKQAFLLVLSLRLLPFVPSGLITFAAAISSIPFHLFLIASSIGKMPALLLEAYSVQEVTNFSWQGKLILAIIACFLIYTVITRLNTKPKDL